MAILIFDPYRSPYRDVPAVPGWLMVGELVSRQKLKFGKQKAEKPVSHPRDPLHGITLENIVKHLVERHGWAEMGHRIPIRCFQINPSVKSSLTFLRKTPWARKRVEAWFIEEKSKPE